jgi:hypothetical protein
MVLAKGLSFKKRFGEMAVLSLSVAGLSFLVGYTLRAIFGIEVWGSAHVTPETERRGEPWTRSTRAKECAGEKAQPVTGNRKVDNLIKIK